MVCNFFKKITVFEPFVPFSIVFTLLGHMYPEKKCRQKFAPFSRMEKKIECENWKNYIPYNIEDKYTVFVQNSLSLSVSAHIFSIASLLFEIPTYVYTR